MDGQRKKHNIRKKNYVSGVAVIILMNILLLFMAKLFIYKLIYFYLDASFSLAH